MKISAVIPAYNEEEILANTVERSVEALGELFDDFEIIIINDASADRTGQIADELAAGDRRIRAIHNTRNFGQGGCQLLGFSEACYELVVHNGADYPLDFRDLSKMLPLLDHADVVIAARTCRPGYTFYRKILSYTNVALLRMLFRLPYSDCNFAQLFKKKVLDAVGRPDARSAGFVMPEIIIRARDMGFVVEQVPIEYHARFAGRATCGHPSVVYGSVRDLFRFFIKRLLDG